MIPEEVIPNLDVPKRVLIEMHDGGPDACDVIVEMEDGTLYTALFVTPPYFHRQMDLCYEVCKQFSDTTPVRYMAVDTPHIVVTSLDRDIIEDTIDNLLAIEVFAGLFTLVTETGPEDSRTTNSGGGKRASQEVAAVVLSDVLVVQG
jgi:hypothetical protein